MRDNRIYDNLGFLDSNRENRAPYKIIDGGNITMQGVSEELFGIPIKNGQYGKPVLMFPNQNYQFDADQVLEVPRFQNGNVGLGFNNNYGQGSNNQGSFTLQGGLTNNYLNNTNTNPGFYQIQRQNQLKNVNSFDSNNIFGANRNGTPNAAQTDYSFLNAFGTTNQISQVNNNLNTTPPPAESLLPSRDFTKEELPDSLRTSVPTGPTQQRRDPRLQALMNPAIAAGLDMNSSLFMTGQSLGFDADQYPLENRDRLRNSNLARGIGAGGKALFNGARLVLGGIGYQNVMDDTMEEYYRRVREGQVGNYVNKNGGIVEFYKNGGKTGQPKVEKILTGEIITGLSKQQEDQVNAELERNEYVKHPNDDVQKVVGKTHAQGGELLNLEEGTKIVSDNLKVGGKLAKELRKEDEISIKAKNTYASAVDKFTKEIGLQKLNDEQEALFKKLKEQEDIKDESTANLNNQFLAERIKEIEDEKKPLLKRRAEFVDKIVEEQEKSKDKGGHNKKEADRDAKKEEERQEEENDNFKNGGMKTTRGFKKMCKKHGLTEAQGLALLKNGGKMKKYQNGNGFVDPGNFFSLVGNSFNTNELSPQQRQSGGFGNAFGNITSEEDLQARLAQINALYPVLSQQLGGVNLQNVQAFQEGFQNNATLISDFVANSDQFEPEQAAAIQASINNELFILGDRKTARDIDNKFGNFTSSRPGFQFATLTKKDKEVLESKGITTYKQLYDSNGNIKSDLDLSATTLKNLDRFKGFKGNFLLGETQTSRTTDPLPTNDLPDTVVSSPVPVPDNSQTGINPLNVRNPGNNSSFKYLPDQSPLLPNGIQPHLKINRRYQRIDPVAITNEENLKELFRQQDFNANLLENTPTSQSRASLANLAAGVNESINKSVTQVEVANAQNRQNTNQFNAQIANREEDARAQDLLNFEQRQLTALAKTEEDLSNYFNKQQEVRLRNFQQVQQMNFLDNLYENFNTDSTGQLVFDEQAAIKFGLPPSVVATVKEAQEKRK